ncbi:succinyl-diaminopimelate desuccinylase [Rubrobacter xylanophilus]|uniref:Probable succinyl-diaminopimelate desuccinylase n=1 Tax=Rubrobacter xylanophilus TaxID=49319 RepID=A0A510HIS7_9ACTN|nr:M20 family metallopeptidase [Rubrobacter xylanophilus]BBL79844.1 succinyl-diaminopimelate desuccinylase [Rubrobacter xylanophilus]
MSIAGRRPAGELEGLLEAVLRRIDRGELVRLARELVRIPSVYRPGDPASGEGGVAAFLAGYLEEAGFEVRAEEVSPGRPNVWAVWEGPLPGPTLLFEAHTDVVTEGRAEDWEHPPFGAEVEDGRLYGRGACDTKGNLAAAVVAVRAIRDAGIPFPGRLVLCHPVDEEGMMSGIKHFIRRGHAEGVDAAIICEPEENQLCVSQKGALRVEVRVRGRMAHGAMPQSGVNPVTRAARFVVEVEKLEREERARLGEDPFLGAPSLTPTILRGPETGDPQLNVVPSSTYVALDVRTVPGQDHGELVGRLENILSRLRSADADFDAGLRVIEERSPTETPPDEPLVRAMAAACRRLTGREPRYNGVPGATDGTFLHAWADIPVVVTGAGLREIPHHADEWVDLDELYETCRLYAASALYYCCKKGG